MSTDTPGGIAQRLERAQLHALVFDHAGQRGHHNERSHRIGDQRENQREIGEHIGIALGVGRTLMRAPVDHQRRGQRGRYGLFRLLGIHAISELYQHLRHGQIRHAAGIDEDVAILIGVGVYAIGHTDKLRAVDHAPHHKAIFLPGQFDAHAVSHGKAVYLGKSRLNQAAARIRLGKSLALDHQRLVDAHGSIIGRHVQRGLARQGAFQFRRGAGAYVAHSADGTDSLQGIAVRAGHADPEIRQVVLGKVRVDRALRQPGRTVQPRKHERPQRAEHHNGKKLHAGPAHIAHQLFSQSAHGHGHVPPSAANQIKTKYGICFQLQQKKNAARS